MCLRPLEWANDKTGKMAALLTVAEIVGQAPVQISGRISAVHWAALLVLRRGNQRLCHSRLLEHDLVQDCTIPKPIQSVYSVNKNNLKCSIGELTATFP